MWECRLTECTRFWHYKIICMRVQASGERPCARTITFNMITEQVLKALTTSVVHGRIQKDYYTWNCTIMINMTTKQVKKHTPPAWCFDDFSSFVRLLIFQFLTVYSIFNLTLPENFKSCKISCQFRPNKFSVCFSTKKHSHSLNPGVCKTVFDLFILFQLLH